MLWLGRHAAMMVSLLMRFSWLSFTFMNNRYVENSNLINRDSEYFSSALLPSVIEELLAGQPEQVPTGSVPPHLQKMHLNDSETPNVFVLMQCCLRLKFLNHDAGLLDLTPSLSFPQSQTSRWRWRPLWTLRWQLNQQSWPVMWPTSPSYHQEADWASAGSTPHFLVLVFSKFFFFSKEKHIADVFLFLWFVWSPAVSGDPQTSNLIGSLDGNGNLLPGATYNDRLKSGVLSLTRVTPNTFKLRFLRTQVRTKK